MTPNNVKVSASSPWGALEALLLQPSHHAALLPVPEDTVALPPGHMPGSTGHQQLPRAHCSHKRGSNLSFSNAKRPCTSGFHVQANRPCGRWFVTCVVHGNCSRWTDLGIDGGRSGISNLLANRKPRFLHTQGCCFLPLRLNTLSDHCMPVDSLALASQTCHVPTFWSAL